MNQIKEYVIQCTHCKYNEHFVQKFTFIDDCIYYTEIIHNAASFYSKKYAEEYILIKAYFTNTDPLWFNIINYIDQRNNRNYVYDDKFN